jgi:hypothetical protein
MTPPWGSVTCPLIPLSARKILASNNNPPMFRRFICKRNCASLLFDCAEGRFGKTARERFETVSPTAYLRSVAEALRLQGRSPDLRVTAKPAAFPSLAEQWRKMPDRSPLTVAQPCGNHTRFPIRSRFQRAPQSQLQLSTPRVRIVKKILNC